MAVAYALGTRNSTACTHGLWEQQRRQAVADTALVVHKKHTHGCFFSLFTVQHTHAFTHAHKHIYTHAHASFPLTRTTKCVSSPLKHSYTHTHTHTRTRRAFVFFLTHTHTHTHTHTQSLCCIAYTLFALCFLVLFNTHTHTQSHTHNNNIYGTHTGRAHLRVLLQLGDVHGPFAPRRSVQLHQLRPRLAQRQP